MRALRLAVGMFLATTALGASLAGGCSSTGRTSAWRCRDPETGMDDYVDFDLSHYVDGVFDPCHCLDPGGPLPTCPTYALPTDAGTDGMDAGADGMDAGQG